MTFRSVLAALALVAAAPTAWAAQPPEAPAQGEPAQRLVPLNRVIPAIARETKGQYLNATVGEQNGKPVYLVQWRLPSGCVTIFVVDAVSGGTLGRQGGCQK